MKKIKLFVLLLMFANTQAQQAHFFFSKDKTEYAPEKWEAKWIVAADVSKDTKNSIMLARKEFVLNEVSKKNVLYITADSHFKLWINGKFVTRGPARCNPHHQSYDVLEISEFLRKGKNSIAVQIHFHGVMKSYYSNPYPGLLVQLEMGVGDQKKYLISDKSWKMCKDEAWDSNSKPVNTVNANNFSSFYDFRKSKPNWVLLDYDSKNWKVAKYQLGPRTFPKKEKNYEPYAIQKPWFSLIPRDLPALKEKNTPANKIFNLTEAVQYSNYEQHWGGKKGNDALQSALHDIQKPLKNSKVSGLNLFLKGEGKLKVANSYPVEIFSKSPVWNTTIVFDYGFVQDGYPYIHVEGESGAIVDVNYAPYLLDGVFHPSLLTENFSDRIILSGGTDVWENTEIRTFRYVSVTVRSQKPVVFNKIGVSIEEYPFEEKGKLNVDKEPFIKSLLTANEKTLQSITTDAFTDNYQERRQYVQTSFYASLGNYATFGDVWLQRRYLVQHAQDQLPNGIMPMWAPWGVYDGNNQVPGIFEANHFWLMGLHDYYLHTGDVKTTKELLVNAERCAEAINEVQYRNNLIYKPPYPYWIDWANLAQGDQNFILNALQLKAFDQYAELLIWLGEKEKSKKWNAEVVKIRQALKRFWSEEHELFAENMTNGKIDDSFSEHANSLAVLTGVASKEQTSIIINKIINNSTERTMEESVLFNYWVSKAICESGKVKEAVSFLKSRYQHMLKKGENGTLWEYANLHAQQQSKPHYKSIHKWKGRSWSTAQAENCFPGIIFSEYILGVKPISPGCREIKINTFNIPYHKMNGSFPTPSGLLEVTKDKNQLKVIVPEDVLVKIMKNDLLNGNIEELEINKESLKVSNLNKFITLSRGAYNIKMIKRK